MTDIKIFSGSANPQLTQEVCDKLGMRIGAADVGQFSDHEIKVQIEENVRGREVFIIQSTCYPCNDHLMELLIMADALRRASTDSITAVIPYFGYARQDRRVRSARVPISAKIIADMITAAGIDRMITVDLHADQIQGFFTIPVDNIYASNLLLEPSTIRYKYQHPLVVSPDVGGVVRARAIAKQLNCDLAIIDKRRAKANQSEVMHVIGQVKDQDCIIVDDMVDTAGTLCQAAQALKDQGAKTISAYCTHPVLSGKAIDNINASCLNEVVVSNSIPVDNKKSEKIKQISLSPLIAETISRIESNRSVSEMFIDQE